MFIAPALFRLLTAQVLEHHGPPKLDVSNQAMASASTGADNFLKELWHAILTGTDTASRVCRNFLHFQPRSGKI